MTTMVDPQDIEIPPGELHGEVIARGAQTYDEARKIWNGHIDRRPALIARCRGVADVMAAVRFARRARPARRGAGGGHAVAGHALCDDGIVIDLRR